MKITARWPYPEHPADGAPVRSGSRVIGHVVESDAAAGTILIELTDFEVADEIRDRHDYRSFSTGEPPGS